MSGNSNNGSCQSSPALPIPPREIRETFGPILNSPRYRPTSPFIPTPPTPSSPVIPGYVEMTSPISEDMEMLPPPHITPRPRAPSSIPEIIHIMANSLIDAINNITDNQENTPPILAVHTHNIPRPFTRTPQICALYDRIGLSPELKETVHRIIGILWNEENITCITQRVRELGPPILFDLLETFQNIVLYPTASPEILQFQDCVMVDLVLRMLHYDMEQITYGALNARRWGMYNDPPHYHLPLQVASGLARSYQASENL